MQSHNHGVLRAGIRKLMKSAAVLLIGGPLFLVVLFRFLPPPVTPLMVIRAVQGHSMHQQWVPIENMSPFLRGAVIASEDNRFCEQTLGFDFTALREQISAWWDGQRPRGASTITMQTAKNLLLWPGRDPIRKAFEAYITPQIALLWPKRRIIEVYLNIVEFGPGIYGAEAAARRLFRKPAADLSAWEAALLAAALPQPLVLSAARPDSYLRQRAATIQHRITQIAPLLACVR